MALGRAHVPPTKVFRRLAVTKTILKARLAAATGGQYVYTRDFYDVIEFRVAALNFLKTLYDIAESNPVPASGL